MRARGVAVAVALVAALAGGCRGRGPRAEPEPKPVARAAAPSYATVAAGYNARVAPLERLWTRTVARVWSPGEGEGEERVDQLEGTLQFIRPDRALVTFSKLNEIYGILGSNAESYWWIQLGQDRVARVGSHAKATPERIARLGLPVHPLDFVDLLGITPLPEGGGTGGAGPGTTPEVAWSADGRTLVVTVPARSAGQRRRVYIDPARYEPSRVEILSPRGETLVYSELQKYEPVAIGYSQGPRVPTEVFVSLDQDRTRARLRLADPESSSRRPSEGIFDLQRLLQTRNVRTVIDLDSEAENAEPPAAGEAASGGTGSTGGGP